MMLLKKKYIRTAYNIDARSVDKYLGKFHSLNGENYDKDCGATTTTKGKKQRNERSEL